MNPRSLQQTVGQAPGTTSHTGQREVFLSAMASPNNACFVFASLAGDPEQLLPVMHHGLPLPVAITAVEDDGTSFSVVSHWMLNQ